jgi:SAM-dependent methyltransferase
MDPIDDIKQTIATYSARSVVQRRHWYSPAAAAYAATRPRYPQQLVDAVVARSGLTAASTLLEVGCGPGTATVSFAELGCRILAIEPNPEFCLLAEEVCQRFPNVKVVTTSFEEWQPRREQFDVVLAATSFHWIPAEIAYPKAAGALRENGWLILLWNKELQPPFKTHEALGAIYRRHAPELDRPYEDATAVAGILNALGQPLQESSLFHDPQHGQWLVESLLAIDDYLTLLTTYSPFLALEAAVRDVLLAELRPMLETLHGEWVPLTHTSAYIMAQRKTACVELTVLPATP